MSKKVYLFYVLLFCTPYLCAAVPNEINYQGRLREYGQPVTGSRTMQFKIYTVATGGVPVWTTGDVTVQVTTGVFNYVMSPSVDWHQGHFWIETVIAGKTLSPERKSQRRCMRYILGMLRAFPSPAARYLLQSGQEVV